MGNWQSWVLTVGEPDRQHWRTLVAGLPAADSFYTIEYLMLSEIYYGNQARLFVFGDATDYVVYPIILRGIDALDFMRMPACTRNIGLFDAITPEYGGPAVRVRKPEDERALLEGWRAAFGQYCREAGIVTEFGRINPFVVRRENLDGLLSLQPNRNVVYIDLRKSDDVLWKQFSKGNRSSIKKGQRLGVQVSCARGDRGLEAFVALHRQTMDRNQADAVYYLDTCYFEQLTQLMGAEATFLLAERENRVIAAALFLTHSTVAHYFLAGSDETCWELCPNNVLLHYAIGWARARGCQVLNLGGGHAAPEDSLYRFKRSFSPDVASFDTYRVIHDRARYDALCLARARYDAATGQPVKDTGFFPPYRRSSELVSSGTREGRA